MAKCKFCKSFETFKFESLIVVLIITLIIRSNVKSS